MNKWIGMGRLTKDPEGRDSKSGNSMRIVRYTLAIDRKKTRNNDNPGADFIPCVVFDKGAEFAEKYFKKGTKIVVEGHIQTGSYEDKNGNRVYTTDIMVENQEFAESKGSGNKNAADQETTQAAGDGFMNIPDGIDEELPFN